MNPGPQQEVELAAWAASDEAWRSVRRDPKQWMAGILYGVAIMLLLVEVLLLLGAYLAPEHETFILLALAFPFVTGLAVGALRSWTALDLDEGKFNLGKAGNLSFLVAAGGLAGLLMPGRLEGPLPLLAMGAPIGAAGFLTAFWAAGPRSKAGNPRWLLGYAAISLGFGWVWAGWLDVNLDRAPPRHIETRVVEKHTSYGRRTRTRSLVLAPSDGGYERPSVVVGWSFYERTEIGDRICLLVHPGALKTPWHEITSCTWPSNGAAT